MSVFVFEIDLMLIFVASAIGHEIMANGRLNDFNQISLFNYYPFQSKGLRICNQICSAIFFSVLNVYRSYTIL